MQRRVYFGVIFLLLALLGAGWWLARDREPAYQGKTLSAWLHELDLLYYDGPDTEEAYAAVQQIGTNAIPHLLRKLQTKEYPWEGWQQWLPHRGFSWLRLPAASGQRMDALAGFRALGQQALPAIPQLLTLCAKTNHDSSWTFAALNAIGDAKVLPNLMGWLTNSTPAQQCYSIESLGNLGHRAQPAIPDLLPFLEHANFWDRYLATRALGQIAARADLVVPALEKRLADTNNSVVMAAADALAAFGPEAAAAIPALQAAARNPKEKIRSRVARALTRVQCEMYAGGILRGPKERKVIALAFTGHEYAEGGETILNELQKHHAKASFFLTGAFLTNANFQPLVQRIVAENHYLGPHSDQHLLYCEWDSARTTRVTREQVRADLESNQWKVEQFTKVAQRGYFIPPYEHYNRQIVDWSRNWGFTLINYTPGTRSNADYTGEADKNFVSSQAIFDSILKREQTDPHGLNGFILLLHIGSGPGRADKFSARFGELLETLAGRGYEFVRVDELLDPQPEKN